MTDYEAGVSYMIYKIEQMWIKSGMNNEEFGRRVKELLNAELMEEAHNDA